MNPARFLFPTLLLAILLGGPAPAEEPLPEDFLKNVKDWAVVFPQELGAKVEIAADAFEGKPALKIEVAEGGAEFWKGGISHEVNLPSAGDYTVAFYARVEPNDANIELSAWSSAASAQGKKILGPRQNCKATLEWQEFLYQFSASAPDPAARISWGNLANGGKTFYIADIRVTKN